MRSPSQWNLFDWEKPSTSIGSIEALHAAIKSLPDDVTTPNRIVLLESPRGDTLSIAIAGPKDSDNHGLTECLALLQFTNSSHDPPYLVPVGNSSLSYENGGVVVFRYDGTWTEALKRNRVPMEVLLTIVQHFYVTEALPDWIPWEEV